jgi:hypothetical protein
VVVLADLLWLVVERRGQTVDIDEAGYFGISMVDFDGWKACGLTCWHRAIVGQAVQAPLAPALASVLHILTGPRVLNTMIVSVVAYGVLLVAATRCTRGWGTPARVTAFALTAGAPVLFHFSRSFNFAVLAAACLAVALMCSVLSDGHLRLGPTLAWGGAVGAMLLSRTMTIAFLPGILLAALVPVATRRSLRSLLHVLAGAGVAFLVAATWYWHNLRSVLDYLHSFGYGARSAEYGSERSLLSARDWYVFGAHLSANYLQVGMTIAVIGGLVLTAATAARAGAHQRAEGGWGALVRRLHAVASSSSVVLTSAVIVASGLAALMSSRTEGSAFVAPLVAPLAIVAARGVESVHAPARQRLAAVGTTVLVAPAALLGLLPIRTVVTVTAQVHLPLLPPEQMTLVDSRGTLRTYLDGGGPEPADAPGPGTAEHGRQWFAASAHVIDASRQRADIDHRPPLIVLTFRHRVLNVNTLALDSFIRFDTRPWLTMLNPALPGETADDVAAQTDRYAAHITMVATADDGPNEFVPTLPSGVGDLVVRRLGFVLLERFRIPDGRWVSLWVAHTEDPSP